MKIKDIIEFLNQDADWVDFNNTRDIVLFGDLDQDIIKVGVCWVATMPAINQAIRHGINFIISHENCFYQEGTKLPRKLIEAKQEKKMKLQEHGICVYRCHDVWDKIPSVGVADTWSATIDLPFNKRDLKSFNSFAYFDKMTVSDIAKKVASALAPFGQDSVTVLGNVNQVVSSLGIGTGAATDIFSLIEKGAECVVLSDDGSTNWIAGQYGVDFHIPIILVHHSISEIPGIRSMVGYLKKAYPELEVSYLDEGYHYHTITNNQSEV